jgi:hypothetical protein
MFKTDQRLRDHLCPHHQGHQAFITLLKGTEMVPETLEMFNRLTWLMARDEFIKVSRHESFVSLIHKQDTTSFLKTLFTSVT